MPQEKAMECEWRFNAGNHKTLLSQLKYWYSDEKH